MIQTIVLISHILIAVFIVGLVLLQRGKGAEAGAAFGAGASGTVFGSRGSSNFLSRTTAVLAAMFFLSSLTLAYYSGQTPEAGSLMDRLTQPSDRGDAVMGPFDDEDALMQDLPLLDDGPEEEEDPFAPTLD